MLKEQLPTSTVVTPWRTDSERLGAYQQFGIVVRVGIEKAWHHPKPGGIDHALGIVISNRIGRHTDNPAILDSKVAG